ncbi:hypothetical protein ACQ4PT_065257 [Festuca glaucescens]
MAPRFLFILLSAVSSLSGLYGQNSLANYPYCSNNTDNFAPASQYQVNLNQLLADLRQHAMANGGFSNSTAGEAPDKVFGLIMCYADHSLSDCEACLNSADAGIQTTCPFSRVARATYFQCVLQYSNEPFFTVADTTFKVVYFYGDRADVVDVARLNATRSKLISRLSLEAASSSLRWTNGSDRYTDSQGILQEIYGITQCTRDLNASECMRCFTEVARGLWTQPTVANKSYGALYGYSCYMRFQIDGPITPITIFPVAQPPQPPPSPLTPLPPLPPVPSSPSSYVPARKRSAMVAGASAGSIAFAIFAGICLWLGLRRRQKGNEAREQEIQLVEDQPMEEEFNQGMGPRRFRYNELTIATNYFSDKEKLGEGGFGSVYHGYLKDEDLHVAVKRVSKTSQQGKKEYVSEVTIISRLRHRNLVQLIGWCHGGGELLLVYELMPNGSLDTHIHNQEIIMSWSLRYPHTPSSFLI